MRRPPGLLPGTFTRSDHSSGSALSVGLTRVTAPGVRHCEYMLSVSALSSRRDSAWPNPSGGSTSSPRRPGSRSTRSATTPAKACSPPPERSGRHKLYGAEHLDRLTRIRELQEQRFSLAAIRALLNADRPGLEALFAAQGRSYSLDELVERSGLDAELVDRLHEVGLLADPAALGHEVYDDRRPRPAHARSPSCARSA